MRPRQTLPIDELWSTTDDYVESLLTFVSTNELFRNLCGGVHVLDFLTREPDLYSWILPQEWRDWFDKVEIADILDLLLREDLSNVTLPQRNGWRGYALPPTSLTEYVRTVRIHSLRRDHVPRNTEGRQDLESLPRHVAVGMKPKKIHEVSQFANFVDDLSQHLKLRRQYSVADPEIAPEEELKTCPPCDNERDREEPTIIDFGSGQNYLGRTLAGGPYNKKVMAIEQRHHNVTGAQGMDVSAGLTKREKRVINKKAWKAQWIASRAKPTKSGSDALNTAVDQDEISESAWQDMEDRIPQILNDRNADAPTPNGEQDRKEQTLERFDSTATPKVPENQEITPSSSKGSIQYVEKALSSGDLSDLLSTGPEDSSVVVSIHSCGNLTHHGLRSISLNPSVHAVALIGCCYNLMSERLGPPTYKLPSLRSNHPRLEATSSAFDPHGFPMSKRLEEFVYPVQPAMNGSSASRKVHSLNGKLRDIEDTGKGIRLNITARMMAVQAPQNWSSKDSEDFFTRHYYRALLQRMLLDLGVVKMAKSDSIGDVEIAGGTLSGKDDSGSPLIIGTLPKRCFVDFEAYVTRALAKLTANPDDGPSIEVKTSCLFANDNELIRQYEKDYHYARKHLSVLWSLMAFSAAVVESTIVVDRWLWLTEQEEVADAWVEAVFDYKQSPRNMVVVGIKEDNRARCCTSQ